MAKKQEVKLTSSSEIHSQTLRPLGVLFAILAGKYEREFLKRLVATPQFANITPADHRILMWISSDCSSSNEISQRAGISKQAVSKVVASLSDRGFIKSRSSSEDGRVYLLTLTKKGEKLVLRAASIARELEQLSVDVLGESAVLTLRDTLNQLQADFGRKG